MNRPQTAYQNENSGSGSQGSLAHFGGPTNHQNSNQSLGRRYSGQPNSNNSGTMQQNTYLSSQGSRRNVNPNAPYTHMINSNSHLSEGGPRSNFQAADAKSDDS